MWYYAKGNNIKENLTKDQAIVLFMPVWNEHQDENLLVALAQALAEGCSGLAVGEYEIGRY